MDDVFDTIGNLLQLADEVRYLRVSASTTFASELERCVLELESEILPEKEALYGARAGLCAALLLQRNCSDKSASATQLRTKNRVVITISEEGSIVLMRAAETADNVFTLRKYCKELGNDLCIGNN